MNRAPPMGGFSDPVRGRALGGHDERRTAAAGQHRAGHAAGGIARLRTATVFIALLNGDDTGRIMALLPHSGVEALTAELVGLPEASVEQADAVLAEFLASMRGGRLLGRAGRNSPRDALAARLGEGPAAELMSRIGTPMRGREPRAW